MIKKQKLREVVIDILQDLKNKEYMDKLFYLFTLIFLKMYGDTWEFKEKQYKEKYYNHRERVNRIMENQPIVLIEKWNNIYEASVYPEINTYLHYYLVKLEEKNTILQGIFSEIDWNLLESRVLRSIIEKLNNSYLGIENEAEAKEFIDVVDEVVIENKLGIDTYNSSAGEEFTAKSVAKLIVKLADIKENEKIGDLVCGSGGLLIQATKMVENRKCQLYGQDIDKKVLRFCRLNMILHQIYDADIKKENTIAKMNTTEEMFDVIIANPPFSVSNSIKIIAQEDEDILKKYPYGIPPASKADYAFIQSMLQSLKNNGKMVTVISLGALTRGGAEQQIRVEMVKDNIIDSIILLPTNLFKNTPIKTCIMVLNKNKAQSDILFIDASNEYKKEKYQNVMEQQNLDKILQLYNNRRTVKEECYLATQKEVLDNMGNLSVTKYIEQKEYKEVSLEQIKVQINDIEERLKLLNSEKEIYFSRLNK